MRKVAEENGMLVWMAGLLLFLYTDADSQDPAFSQFYANPLYMNPAMAGIEGPAKVYLGYRNQWPGATNPYVTYHASYDQYIEILQGGVGLHVDNDRQGGGVFNTLSVDAIYAYHLQVNSHLMVSGGFQASVGQRNMNPSDLVLPSELAGAGTTTLVPYSKVYPDFAFGLGGFYKNFFGGFAVHHLLEPYGSPSEDPNTRLLRKYTAHVGAMIPIIEKRLGREVLQLSPHLVFMQQDIYQQLNYGLEVLYRGIIIGAWFRQDLLFSYGTAIFSAGYGNGQFRIRYSYDAKLSPPDLHIPTLGAHEISLVAIFENLNKSTKHRAIKCPKI
ncbi:MAG: PorP/SprF family type IX secretion system membrane protein [Bacteroidota bacterium]|nr:PorP/SprF family type IX secretion system membrane protein [Bacteroidota bacterium]